MVERLPVKEWVAGSSPATGGDYLGSWRPIPVRQLKSRKMGDKENYHHRHFFKNQLKTIYSYFIWKFFLKIKI